MSRNPYTGEKWSTKADRRHTRARKRLSRAEERADATGTRKDAKARDAAGRRDDEMFDHMHQRRQRYCRQKGWL